MKEIEEKHKDGHPRLLVVRKKPRSLDASHSVQPDDEEVHGLWINDMWKTVTGYPIEGDVIGVSDVED